MYIELISTIVLFGLSFLIYFRHGLNSKKSKDGTWLKSLPGPRQFPVVGSIPSIMYNLGRNVVDKSSFEVLDSMKKIWGSPIAIRFGSFNAVLIDDLKTTRKLMISEDWSNRLDSNPIWYARSFDNHYGLLISNGEGWKEMRKFVHKTLTRHGFGRTRALEMIHEIEILNFFDHLDKLRMTSQGQIIEMQGLFNVSTFNILWRMVAGSRFSYNNTEIIQMMKVLEEFAHGLNLREMGVLIFPWLSHFPAFSGFDKFIESHKKMQNFFLHIISERRRIGEYKEKQETFIDVFLQEIDRHKAENSNPNYYTDEQCVMVLVDLFLTGFIPTASCVEFLVMFMILHPEIQRKVHDEIDTVIGRTIRFPSINDTDKMPYTQAVCLEVLRHVTFIPITTRSATKDTQINDFFIPKGTIAALNIYGMHHDKKIWKKPNEFIPERFLDENGRLTDASENMLPFGAGKRICPAEVYARVSTFTYFTYLMQKYSFECPPGATPDPTPNVGLGNYAKPFSCIIRERQLVSSTLIANATTGNGKTEDIGTFV